MWPFTCKRCAEFDEHIKKTAVERITWQEERDQWFREYFDAQVQLNQQLKTGKLKWLLLESNVPPINTNLLVANKDFTYFGFLYYEDGWDYSRRINMHFKDRVFATYTNADSIHWWLSIDMIEKQPKAEEKHLEKEPKEKWIIDNERECRSSDQSTGVQAPSLSKTN